MNKQISNKKALLCSQVFLQKTVKTPNPASVQIRTELNLLKYFPKYINHLHVPVKTASTISKVKHIKILSSFQTPSNTGIRPRSKKLQRTWLRNKEKYIRQIYTFLYTKSLAQEIKAFQGLRTLFLSDPIRSYFNLALESHYLKKICQRFRTLINLKHLSLKIDCEQYLYSISKTNSCQKLLNSLDTLKIFFHCAGPTPEAKLLEHLLTFKNVLKATTHLDMIGSENKDFIEICSQLLETCQKLTFFDIKEVRGGSYEYSLLPTEAPSCFPALKNLNSLRTLKVRISQTWSFLRDFVLPPFVQSVEIDFLPFKTQMPLLPILMDFCEKWNDANLHSLKVQFRQKIQSTDFLIPFLQQWIKRIKSIQILSLQLTPPSPAGFSCGSLQKTLDFSTFFQSIKHLENSLRSLTLFDGQILHSIKNLPEKPLSLYSLKKFTLEGPAIPDINKFFAVNLIDLINLEKEEPLEINLKGQIFNSMESFKSFVQIFDQQHVGKRTLIIGIQAHIKNQSAIESSIQIPNKSFSFKLVSKNTTLKFKVTTKQEFEFIKSLQVLELEEASQEIFF